MKKAIIAGAICVAIAMLVFFNLPERNAEAVEGLHINSEVVRLESDMSKRLSISTYGGSENKKNYKLVSENEFIAVCEGNSVSAVNEGETFVYAKSTDGKTQSNRVKVIVSNDIFDTAAKIIMLANAEQYFDKEVSDKIQKHNEQLADKEKIKNVEITPEKVSQITETEVEKVPEIFDVPIEKEDESDKVSDGAKETSTDVVYITKSGKKFHLSTCASAKNSTPISRSEAISKGKTPCQKCKP